MALKNPSSRAASIDTAVVNEMPQDAVKASTPSGKERPDGINLSASENDTSTVSALRSALAAIGSDHGVTLPTEDERLDEFAAKYPLTAAALGKWREDGKSGTPRLSVTAREHGFRRGGIAHPAEQTEHLLLNLKPDQVEAILADPDLITEIV